MTFDFHKFQGTGNDFVMIDNRQHIVQKSNVELFSTLCNRRFGVGADGVILIQNHPQYAFEMVYINADGNEGSMCGNGGRCAVKFAEQLGIVGAGEMAFLAVDGAHRASIKGENVELHMMDVALPSETSLGGWFINTGSPHHLSFVANLDAHAVDVEGAKIRWDAYYAPGGTNVNFIQKMTSDTLRVRTFERGVEAETYSCGTGVTAAAVLHAFLEPSSEIRKISIQTQGGVLEVRFKHKSNGFSEIYLIGPAKHVFTGKMDNR